MKKILLLSISIILFVGCFNQAFAQPTVPCSNIITTVGGLTGHGQINITWTNGNGNGRLVVCRPSSSPAVLPTDGITNYTINRVYGLGTNLGSNNYCVYRGTGNTAVISGLTAGTNYTITIFEYVSIILGAGTSYTHRTATYPSAVFTPDASLPTGPSSLVISAITTAGAKFTWRRGGGNAHIAVVKPYGNGVSYPNNGVNYVPNTVYGSGSNLGNTTYVVYLATDTTVTITGLALATHYHVTVYDLAYTSSTALASYVYNVGTPLVGSFWTTTTEPTGQATSLVVTPSYTTASLSWTTGSGAYDLATVGTPPSFIGGSTAAPKDGNWYTANTVYGSGEYLAPANFITQGPAYSVYSNTGTSVAVSGLTPARNYIARAFTFNYGVTDSTANYMLTSAPSISFSTLNNTPTLDNISNQNFCYALFGTQYRTIALTGIGDGGIENQNLTVTAVSSNPTLITIDSVSYTQGSTTGTVYLHYPPATTGSTNVTVTVNDGWTSNNTISDLFAVSIVTLPANPGTITGSSPVCRNSTVKFSVPANSAVNFNWTVPAGATYRYDSTFVIDPDGNYWLTLYNAIWVKFSGTTVNSGNITVYTSNFAGCTSSLLSTYPVTIQDPVTNAAGVIGSTSICSGTTGLIYSVTAANATNYAWTVATPFTVTAGAGTNTITVSAGTGTNTTRLISVDQSNSCGTIKSNLNVYIAAPTTISNAGPNQTICGNTVATLAANSPATGTKTWSIVSGGAGTFSNNTSATSTFTGTLGNTYVLRWTTQNSPCLASTDDVTITFGSNPTQSNAGTDQTKCGVTSTTLAANTPSSGTGAWSILSGTGGSFSSTTNPSATFTGTAGSTYQLIWAISTTSCGADYDTVAVTFPLNPTTANAGSDIVVCGGTSTSLVGNVPVVGSPNWALVSGTGGTITQQNNSTATLTGIAGNSYVVRYRIRTTLCGDSYDTLAVSFPLVPSNANASSDQTLCGATSAILAGNTPAVGVGTWSISTGGSGSFSNANSPTATFVGTAGNTYSLKWTITNSTCSPKVDSVTIAFPKNPTPSAAGSNQTLCGLTSTSLAANTPASGAGTGSWSQIATTSGVFTSSTNPTTTFTGTAGTSYNLVWSIATTSCGTSRDTVTVSFPRNPTGSNAGTDQIKCGQTSATLAANSPTFGTGLWTITSGTGGSFSSTSNPTATFTGLAGNNYTLRWTISNAPCTASSSSVNISFPLNPSAANAGSDVNICNGTVVALSANTPSVGTGLWTIASGSATIANTASATTTASAFASNAITKLVWSISNASCTVSRDTVTINSNNSFCGATVADFTANKTSGCAGDAFTFSDLSTNPLTWAWNFGSGASPATSTLQVPPTVTYSTTGTKTVSLTVTGLANNDTRTRTNYITIIPVPSAAGTISGTPSICAGTTGVTYSVASITNASSYVWTLPTGASIASGNGTSSIVVNFSGAAISGNINVYGTNSCGNGAVSANYAVTVSQNPSVSNAGPDQTVCGATSTTLAANAPSSGTGAWSIISGTGGSFSLASNAAATFSGTAGNAYVLVWTISNGACNASSDSVSITFPRNPSTSNAGPDQTLCGLTSASLAANTPTYGTGAWSIVSGTGGSFSNAASPVSVFIGNAGSTYTLRWTISNAPCVASTNSVIISFPTNPSVSNAGPDQTICGSTSTALAANTPSNGTGTWTIISGTGGSFSSASNPSSTFTGTVGTSYTLRWTISKAPCTDSNDDVQISFQANPTTAAAGADQTICGANSATLAANTAVSGTGSWSILAGTGGSFSSTTNPSATFSGSYGQQYTLRWTITTSTCGASTDDVLITFYQNPSNSNAGPDQTLCGSTSALLAANTPTVGTGAWTILSGTGGSFSSTTNPAATFSGIAGNTYTLRWTISNATCTPSTNSVVISFPQSTTTSNAGSDQTLCGSTSATLAANTPLVGTGLWTILSGSGGSFSLTSNPAAVFSGVAGNTYTLRWTISSSCGSSTDDVQLIFPLNPTLSNAGADQSLCGQTSTSLAANTPSVGTGNWTVISGSGGSFSAASNSLATFTGTAGNSYTLRWTISNSPCVSSTDDVTISFPRNPTTSNAGVDQTLCGSNSAVLSANSPTSGTGTWTIISGSGGSFTNTSSNSSTFNGTSGSTYVLRWTIATTSCGSSTDNVTIAFPNNSSIADAGPDLTLCGTNQAFLSSNTPAIGIGVWSVVSGTGGSFSNVNDPSAVFTGNAGSNYSLRWTVTNAPCAANTDVMQVSFLLNPSLAAAGSDTIICNGTSINLNANTPTVGTGTWTILSGVASLVNYNSPTSSASSFLANDTTLLVWTISSGNSCPDSQDTILVISDTSVCIVTLADFSANNTTLCIGAQTTFTDLSNQATSWNWNFGAGASPSTISGIGPHTVTYSTAGFKTVSLTVSGPGGTDTKTKTNYVNVRALPGTATVINGATTICAGQSNVPYDILPLSDADYYVWTVPSGAAINNSNQNAITVDYSLAAINGNVSVQGFNTCGSGIMSSISITANPLPGNAGLISGNDTLCDGSANVLFTVPTIANASSYEWILSSGLTSVSGSNSTATPQIAITLSTGINNGTIRVYARNSCGDGDTSAVFNFYVAPYPGAANAITGATTLSACANQNGISYSIPPISNATGYNWTLPPLAAIVNGANTNTITVNYDALSVSGNVVVNGVNACGTGASSLLAVNFNSVPSTEICYATVDSATVQCLLFWQRPVETYVDSFVIYSDPTGGSNLTRIAAIKNTAAISTNYLDPFSNPIINSVAYQIATKDSCNNQLSLSATVVHKTINLNGTLGWSGAAKLYWNEYLGITDPGRYYSILRDTIGTGPFNDTLATNITPAAVMNYTDATSFLYPNCRYLVVMDFSTNCDPTQRILLNKSTSRSNIKNRAALGPDAIKENYAFDFSAALFPNPATEKVNLFLLGSEKAYRISVCDIVGKTVYSEQLNTQPGVKAKAEMDVRELAPGIYLVRIESEKGGSKIMKLKVE